MDVEELFRYAYVKRPLHEIYPDPATVPPEFLLEWLKDAFDHERIHTADEIADGAFASPEWILEWLEAAASLTWEAKKTLLARR